MAQEKLEVLITAKDEASSVLSGIGNILTTGLGTALGVLTAQVIPKFVEGLGSIFTEAMEAQEVEAQLNAVIESTGGVAGISAQEAMALADSLSEVTRFSDDAIVTGENMLLTFTNIGEDVFPAAIQTMLDMSTALGQDLSSSAMQLGKALNDPIAGVTALRRVGVNFTDEQQKMIKAMVEAGDVAGAQAFILGELQTEFGGSAEAAGTTFAGQLDILKNSLSNVAEGIGMSLLPVGQKLIDNFITPALPLIQSLGEAFSAFISVLAEGGGAGDAFDAIGEFLPKSLSGVSHAFYEIGGFIERIAIPAFQALGNWIVGVGVPAIMSFAQSAATFLQPILQSVGGWIIGTLVPALGELWNWLSTNLPIAIQALSAFWSETLLPAITVVWEWITGTLIPVLSDLWYWLSYNLGNALILLSNAWSQYLLPAMQEIWTAIQENILPLLLELWNWFNANLPGAIETVGMWFSQTLLPALEAIWKYIGENIIPILADVAVWLIENIPVAIQAASDFWNNTLLPALNTIWAFINDSVIPIFTAVVTWLATNIPAAISTVSDFWNNTLLPALTAVYDYLSVTVFPLFTAVADFFNAGFTLAITALAGLWQNVLQPAVENVANAVSTNLKPILEDLESYWTNIFGPALDAVKTNVLDKLKGVFDGIKAAIGWVIVKIELLTDALGNVKLPTWLTPGSPTPFEMGLRGIAAAMDELTSTAMPGFAAQMSGLQAAPMLAGGGPGQGGATTNNYYQLSANYAYQSEASLTDDVRMLEMLTRSG